MSLLYTMQGMRGLGHTCIVALARPSSDLVDFYEDAGFKVIPWPGLALWDHSAVAPRPLWNPFTWQMLADLVLGWHRTSRRTLELVKEIKPDLVHLNSMTFTPSAHSLIQAGIPFVWHVREPPPDQGLRTQLIRRVMLRAPQMIFISEYDRYQWVKGTKGTVVTNFVDLQQFRPDTDGRQLRRTYNIPPDAKVILYLGGISKIKGFYVLLEALHILKQRGFPFVCLAPGTVLGPAQSRLGRMAEVILPLVGGGTPKQQARKRIASYGLESDLRQLPFAAGIVPYFAASDVAVFPSIRPHYARPVIESIAMHKPAVGSDLGGVRELLAIHPLGRTTRASDSVALADAIQEVTRIETKSVDLEEQFSKAKSRFDRQHGIHAIEAIYRTVLKMNHAR